MLISITDWKSCFATWYLSEYMGSNYLYKYLLCNTSKIIETRIYLSNYHYVNNKCLVTFWDLIQDKEFNNGVFNYQFNIKDIELAKIYSNNICNKIKSLLVFL